MRALRFMSKAATYSTLVTVLSLSVFAQTQTTGRIAGTVEDQIGALVAGATVSVTNIATRDQRVTATDDAGRFSVTLLPPGLYKVRIIAVNFAAYEIDNVAVSVGASTDIRAVLQVAGITTEPVAVTNAASLIKTDSPALGRGFDGREAVDLPLPTRNVFQLLTLTPGVNSALVDSTVVGRNPPALSVNGARVSQNSFQVNGIETGFGTVFTRQIVTPAPESISELKIQTSLHDATFGRAGGGSIQVVTQSGTNTFGGSFYDYFSDTSFNANNPFLKAAGQPRPVLERNIFGATLGGPIIPDRAFFFLSYQTARERNGASILNSISSDVLIGTATTPLTDDRSRSTLEARFPGVTVDLISLRLLNARVSGEYLIPTPQRGSLYSGSAISRSREQQFTANLDLRLSERNRLSAKMFYANAPQVVARSGVSNVPGFPVKQNSKSLVVSIQNMHAFGPGFTNEARVGLGMTMSDSGPEPPFHDTDFNIARRNKDEFPGFPLFTIAVAAGGIAFGPGGLTYGKDELLNPTLTDILYFNRHSHSVRLGAEVRYYHLNFSIPIQARGNLVFNDFLAFLRGTVSNARLSTGIPDRAFRTTDYNFFIQDDWKVTRSLSVNLGLRYELDPPPYDTRGRIATFDPSLYLPPANPGERPAGGLVQAGNAIPAYDRDYIANVGKRVVNGIDANNLAPRLGVALVPFSKLEMVFRAGYGIYYSRSIFSYLVNNIFHPPFYFSSVASNRNLSDPYAPTLPAVGDFPIVPLNSAIGGFSFDRNLRTPYVQHFNGSVQFGIRGHMTGEISYVGSRGLNLFRQVAINQAQLATPGHPVNNNVTTNEPANTAARLPFLGVQPGSGFTQDQTTARASYHSLQASLSRRFSQALVFQISYTLSKSIDTASGGGGGGSTTGFTDPQGTGESAGIIGDQFDSRANRGRSNFDRRHRLTITANWMLPKLRIREDLRLFKTLTSGWRIATIVTAASGTPIDIIDTAGATFYFPLNTGGGRPNFVPGVSPTTPTNGYFFNPFAFARAIVRAGDPIPSSTNNARAGANGTDFGNVPRNVLTGPSQFNMDVSLSKRFELGKSRIVEVRCDAFNVLNTVNFANPISNFNAVAQAGLPIDPTTGQIGGNPGNFGRVVSTSSNQRILQLAFRLNF